VYYNSLLSLKYGIVIPSHVASEDSIHTYLFEFSMIYKIISAVIGIWNDNALSCPLMGIL